MSEKRANLSYYLFLLMFLGAGVALLTSCIGSGEISGMKWQGKGQFPKLTGIDLMGEERALPQSFTGKRNLVVVAFQRKQQQDVDKWIQLAETLMQNHPELRFYEIPVIYEVSAPYRFWINNGMRSGIPDPVARGRTITVYTNREPFFEAMQMREESIYALILEQDGEILWRHEGVPDKNTVEQLSRLLVQDRAD